MEEEGPDRKISNRGKATMRTTKCLPCNCSDVEVGMAAELDMERPSVVYCPTVEADTDLVYWDRWTLAEVEDLDS